MYNESVKAASIPFSLTNVESIDFTSNANSGDGSTQYIIFNFINGTKRQYGFNQTGIEALYYNGTTWSPVWTK